MIQPNKDTIITTNTTDSIIQCNYNQPIQYHTYLIKDRTPQIQYNLNDLIIRISTGMTTSIEEWRHEMRINRVNGSRMKPSVSTSSPHTHIVYVVSLYPCA